MTKTDAQLVRGILEAAGYGVASRPDHLEISRPGGEWITAHLAPSPDEPGTTDCLFACPDETQDGRLVSFPEGRPDGKSVLRAAEGAFSDGTMKTYVHMDEDGPVPVKARSLGEAARIVKSRDPSADVTARAWTIPSGGRTRT